MIIVFSFLKRAISLVLDLIPPNPLFQLSKIPLPHFIVYGNPEGKIDPARRTMFFMINQIILYKKIYLGVI